MSFRSNITTYQLAVLNVEHPILVPKTVLAIPGRPNQQGDQVSQIMNVDVAPDVLTLVQLEAVAELQGSFRNFWSLDAPLVDWTSAYTVDERSYDQCGLDR